MDPPQDKLEGPLRRWRGPFSFPNRHSCNLAAVGGLVREPAWNPEVSSFALGLVTSDWCDKLILLEQVGGRAHATQCIRFVWSCGGADYCHDGADDFSRDAYRRRRWQFEMLRQRWNRKSVLNVASVAVQCESEFRP